MKKLISLLNAAVVSLGLMVSALAQTPAPTPTPGTKTPGIKKRQIGQQQRIAQGVRSGELTRKEIIKLEKEQKEIQQDKKEAKADGTVTKEERKAIHKEQNQASRHIYRAKHNKRDRQRN